ncbi:MAG: permease-like cell division protein FtsX [Rikenellaceae bacterium]
MSRNRSLKRKVRNSYLISTVSIALVLFLLGSVGYMLLTAMDLSTKLQSGITATVELKSNITDLQRENIRRTVASFPLASEVRYSSKDDKINNEEFREMFGLEFERILEDNPLMDSFEVTLSAHTEDIQNLDEFAAEIKALDGVDRVSYPSVLIEQVHSTVRDFQFVILLFGGALLFISLVLLNNTIRMAIFSRRVIINTMKLVGATKWFIIRPFLWSGIWSGFWAGVLAASLLAASIYALFETLPGLLLADDIYRLATILIAMVGGGVIITLIFTWISVSRFVNMKSNRIYLY